MKFRKKLVVIEAILYQRGMEDGFVYKTGDLVMQQNMVGKEYEAPEMIMARHPELSAIPIIRTLKGYHETCVSVCLPIGRLQ